MEIFLLAAFVFAVLEALALWKNIPRLEYLAKPAVTYRITSYRDNSSQTITAICSKVVPMPVPARS